MRGATTLKVIAISTFLFTAAAFAQPQNGPDWAPGLAGQGVAGSQVMPASGSKASKRRLFHRKKQVPASEATGQ